MDLNHQHLLYFATVARTGSVQEACRLLHLAPPTVSGQIKKLEAVLGQPLFQRVGRGLVLTPFGEELLPFAEAIFEASEQLARHLRAGTKVQRPLRVGVSHAMPKLLTRQCLSPVWGHTDEIQLVVSNGHPPQLLGQLAAREIDLVLTDTRPPPWMAISVRCVELESTPLALFGTAALHEQVKEGLPHSLGNVPWLVPGRDTALRRSLDRWWAQAGITPTIAAEVHDSGLVKALGEKGVGVFGAPSSQIDDVVASYHVECVGTVQDVVEDCFAVMRDEEVHDEVLELLSTPLSQRG